MRPFDLALAPGLSLSWSRNTITLILCPDTLVMQWRAQIQGIKGAGDASRTAINMHESGSGRDVIA